MDITSIILCGGKGSRLWPLSTNKKPKQFLKLFSNKSLFQETVLRIKDISKRIIISTYKDYVEYIENELDEINVDATIVIEPEQRNTASSIALCGYYTEDDSSMLILPSDHLIKDVEEFHYYIKLGYPYTKKGIVTFGIQPTYPETGYGYISIGEKLSNGVYKINQFVEKPNKQRAKQFLEKGNYLWNSGMFFVEKKFLVKELEKIDKSLYNVIMLGEKEFFNSTKNSFDYAVMEKTDNGICLKTYIQWSDIGSWESVYNNFANSEDENIILDKNYKSINIIDSNGNLIITDKNNICLIDVNDLVVVENENSLLVINKSSSQKLRNINLD